MTTASRGLVVPLLAVAWLLGAWGVPCARGQSGAFESAVRDAREAGVPGETVSKVLALGYENKMELGNLAELLGLLTEAHREGLPLDPLVGKIEEGMVKRVPSHVIAQVVSRRLADYRFGKALLETFAKRQGTPTPQPREDLARFTETLYCGLTRDDLEHVVERAPPALEVPALVRAAEVLASLKQMQFGAPVSEKIVTTGLKRNYFTSERKDFSRILATARSKGVPLEKITSAAIAAVERGLTSAELASSLGVSSGDMGSRGPQVGGRPGANQSQSGPGVAGEKGRGSTGSSTGSGAGPSGTGDASGGGAGGGAGGGSGGGSGGGNGSGGGGGSGGSGGGGDGGGGGGGGGGGSGR